ncbi:MAG: ABC transporter ATP-binding protein [Pseudomonadota bacterium]
MAEPNKSGAFDDGIERLARPFAVFERFLDPFAAPSVASAPPQRLVPFLRWALADARWPIAAFALVAFCVGAVEAATFYLIGGLVDRAVATGAEAFFTKEAVWLGALLVAVLVLKPAAQVAQTALTSLTLGPGLHQMTLWRLHRHTLGQSMRFFDEDFAGRLSQKQAQTSVAMMGVVADTLSGLGMLTAYLVTMALLLASAEPWLGATVVAWALVFGLTLRWGVPKVRARSKARAAARAAVAGQMVDSFTNIKTVKLFAHGALEEAAARRSIADLRDKSLAFGRAMTAMRLLVIGLNASITLIMVFGALYFWSMGAATIGVIAMAAMMTLRLTAMSNWMAQTALNIFGEIGTIEDGAQTLSPAHEIVDRKGAMAPALTTGAITFDDVTFTYGRPTGGVKGLSLQVAAGEKVGLVGRSGAGKSTAVSLLLRLYDVESGRVLIDGHDVRAITQDSLRRAIATVTQETAVFNRSALDNIRYGNPDATDADVFEAARRARAHGFLLDLADAKGRTGYAAHLGERGVKLSGGQRQRISLARAILKDAPVLVLDEATSALDSEVEGEIQDALSEVMADKTVLAIAHRLSTLSAMDRILVLDAGRVVEEGTHGVLLAKGGLYADLWRRQSGGFLAAAE